MSAFFDHDREEEARAQSRLIDALSVGFSDRIASLLDREAERMLAVFAATGNVPPASDEHEVALRLLFEEMAEASVRTFGSRILTQGKALGYTLEVKDDPFSFAEFFRRVAQDWIQGELIRQRIVSIARTTRRQIVDAIGRGQRAGLGVDAIARDISESAPGIARRRAALIARTELHSAANAGANETAKATGLPLVKEWVATEDARTRSIARDDAFDHASMDGQRRDMDQPFHMPWIGGEPISIMFPGEPGHPGGATINCRCSIVHQVKRP